VPPLGLTTPGASTDESDANNMNGSRIVTGAQAGSVREAAVYVAAPVDAPPHDQFQLAIYSDSQDAPNALLARSAQAALTADAWNAVPITVTLLPHTAYWVMYNTNGTSTNANNLRYTPGSAHPIDRAFQSPRSAVLDSLARLLGDICGVIGSALIALALALWVGRRAPTAALALLLAFGAGLLLEAGLKRWLFFPVSGGYPSGHMLRAMLLAVVVQRLVPWRTVGVVALAVAGLVGLSRMYVGEHFWYEVVGGAIAGWGLAQLALSAFPLPGATSRSARQTGRSTFSV
jgi:membrane-associated phospholipid phosphatase